MTLLLVAAEETLKHTLEYHLQPMGFTVVHYDDPVRAIREIDDLRPEMVLFSAADYPRHWKPLLKLLRERRDKEESVFILLADSPPLEEGAKAVHLGVNGILDVQAPLKRQLLQLEELYRRYRSVKDKRRFHRLVPGERDRLELIFSHPRLLSLITGTLKEISIRGASFQPSNPATTADLHRDDQLTLCTLRVGEAIVSLTCRVARNDGEMGLEFRSFETGGHNVLSTYIQGRSQRELEQATLGEGTA
jgi:hypothetical protein